MAISSIASVSARTAVSAGTEFARVLSKTPSQVAPRAPRPPSATAQVTQVLERVHQAQKRLDQILSLAASGKTFSPAELLSFQAQVYRSSQDLDLAGKVVEKTTSGLKQVLQTQV